MSSPGRGGGIRVACAGLVGFLLGFLASGSGMRDVPGGGGYYLPSQYAVRSEDRQFYAEAISRARARDGAGPAPVSTSGSIVRWGLVSHHLLIRDLIAKFFETLSSRARPRTIVILGPNHYLRGVAPIAVSRLAWKTPYGFLSPGEGLIATLLRDTLAAVDEDAFYNEHSIGALVPFVRYYFPRALVVPIILRPDVDTATARRLASFLSRLDPGVLCIGSLDFSHYKPSSVAWGEDSITYDVIAHFDPSRWGEASVDSHIILRVILQSCNLLGAHEITMVRHTNSGELEKRPDLPCTSYMNMLLSQKQY